MTRGLNKIEGKIYKLAKPYLATRDNDIHTKDALEFALKLLETGKGDRSIVIPAIILHDVGWSKVKEDIVLKAYGPHKDPKLTRIHEEEGVKIAAKILKNIGYDNSKVNEILQIIDRHDTGKDSVSINDQIVKDADKLSRYSESFWLIVKNFGYNPQEYYRKVESWLEDWFFLPVSKQLAREELKKLRVRLGITDPEIHEND